ncbi:MAG: protein-glutamate O-methyltransferase CheR [Actinomycetota bacterium]|nr:protein-glutamate O-methyltransferase CheR [Actinomycetota bacterium]
MTIPATGSRTQLSPADFGFLREYLYQNSAMLLQENKEYLVVSRLVPVAEEFGLESLGQLIAELRRGARSHVATRVVEAMTINETLWFRDVRPFFALRDRIIPELLRLRGSARRLSIWSAASSTGQELYSAAMLLDSHFPTLEAWNLTLLGTDINETVVHKAREGRYSTVEMNRGLPAEMLARYFVRQGGHYQISERIRRRTRFSAMNLARPWPLMPEFDVIMLRNVLIYFDPETRGRVLGQAMSRLAPGGYLILGAGEAIYSGLSGLEPIYVDGTTYYRRNGGGGA